MSRRDLISARCWAHERHARRVDAIVRGGRRERLTDSRPVPGVAPPRQHTCATTVPVSACPALGFGLSYPGSVLTITMWAMSPEIAAPDFE